MKKMRKGKKILLIVIAVILIVLAVVLVLKFVKKPQEEPENPVEQIEPVIPLPDTTYSDMEVKEIHMQYLKDQDKTMLNLEIRNTSGRRVENEKFNAVLVNENGVVIGEMPTSFEKLDVDEECNISVILSGDLTATTQVRLVKL